MMKNLKLYLNTKRNLIALCFILLFVMSITPCAKGCLKCNETGDACLICDSTFHYNLNDQGVCEKLEDLVNCKITVHEVGKILCLQCMENLIFDEITGKCIDIPAASQIFGCQYYNQVGECASCKPDFYFQNGKCNETIVEVEHCLEFSDKSYCSVCEGARKFNSNSGKCENFEPATNCIGHIDYVCNQCIDGYNLLPNPFDNLVLYSLDSGPNIEFVNSINTRKDFLGFWRENPLPQCTVSEFTNCSVYIKENNVITGCETCSSGFLKDSDGKCVSYPFVKINNCTLYKNGTTCQTCENQYYLDSLVSGNKCLPSTEVENCETFSQTLDACTKCLSTHFLQNSSTCTIRENSTIVNCELYSISADVCLTCTGSLKLTDDNLACLTPIDNCDTYGVSTKDTTALVCTICDQLYYPDQTEASCLLQNVTNCENYTSNTNDCILCESGYYKVGTTTISCSEKSVSHCEILKTGDDNNLCQKCNNLYKLDINELCVSIEDSACLENSARDDQCTKCLKGYYIDGKVCTESDKTYDSLCSSSTLDGVCDTCLYGYIPFKLDSYLENLPSGCVSADSSSGNCTQCDINKSGTPSDGTNPPSCATATDTSGKCKQLIADTFEDLGDNDTKCAQCRDLTLNYNNAQTCDERAFHYTIHCSEFETNTPDCKSCEEGYSLQNLNENYHYCTKDQSDFTAVTGCLVHDLFDTSKCLLCNIDQKLDSDSCINLTFTPDSSNSFYYDIVNNKVISQPEIIETSIISSCTKYTFSANDFSTILCTQCEDGYLLQVGNENVHVSLNTNNSIVAKTNKYGTSCENGVTWIRHTSGSDGIVTNCGSVVNAATSVSTDVKCISCKDSYVPTFKEFSFDSTDTGISNVTGVSQCTEASTIDLSITNKTVLNEVINSGSNVTFDLDEIYDTCANNLQNPVYTINNTNRFYVQNGSVGSETSSVQCVTLVSGSQIENCKTYGATSLSENAGETTLVDSVCIACAPGFKRESSFTSCVEIEDCDISSTNTLNNACETCKEGFSYEASSSNNFGFVMSSCVETPNHKKNCLLFEGEDCRLCKNGYDFDYEYGNCELIDSTCSLKGFPHENLSEITVSDNTAKEINSLMINYWFKTELQNGPLPCSSCPNGQSLYSVTSANHSDKVCILNQYNRQIIEGCKIFDGKNLNECLTCKDEYILELQNKTCLRRSDDPNYYKCEVLTSSGNCETCKRGYLPDSDNICIDPNNCLDSATEFDKAIKCKVCKEGYKQSNNSSILSNCERIEKDDYFCNQRGGIENKCLKCKDCRKTVLDYMDVSSNYSHSLCVFHQNSISLSNYALSIHESGSDKHVANLLSSANMTGKFVKTTFIAATNIPQYVCVRGPTDPNCTSWDSSIKYKCTACKNGYYPDQNLQRCVKGTIEGCLQYVFQTESISCSQCDDVPNSGNNFVPYYKNGNTCRRQTKQNCTTFSSSSSSTCTNCYNGYELLSNSCNSADEDHNCKVFEQNSTNCEECNPSYYLKSSDKTCHAYTVKNCSTYDSSSDSCSSCIEDFYLSGISCLQNTCTNCDTKSQISNRCQSCPSDGKNYYKKTDVGCVEHATIANCEIYSTNDNICSLCINGFYVSNGMCVENPTGVANCGIYTDMVNCFSCIDGYYIKENVCEALTITISDCLIYSADGTCSTCKSGKLLATDGTSCISPNESSCATWTDTDNCATCSGNYYLTVDDNDKNICKVTNIAHCLEADNVNNLPNCLKCSPGFILKEGKCNSPKILINDCETYDIDTEKCIECFDGFILSSEKDKCNRIINNSVDFCAKGNQPEDGKYVCNLCKWGSYKNNEGECETCGGDGCAICDKTDRTKCSLCIVGYYMTSTYSCSLNDPPVDDASVKLTQTMMIFLIITLLIKWDN